ncbi:MAG: hypothetical protein ACREJX_02445, partial [Polyangiaceae bacterium]
MANLRTHARYWVAVIGGVGVGALYVAPVVEAIVAPAPVLALPSLGIPAAWYPPLRAPKLHATPALPKVAPYKAPKRQTRRLPVIRDSYSFVTSTS